MSTTAKLSLEDYDRMIERGDFDSPKYRRIELICGELQDMSPIGPQHDSVVQKLTRWSTSILSEDEAGVRTQGCIGIPALNSVPQPDIAWLAPGDYWSERPQPENVFLIIEVAESSLDHDRDEKAALYARAGIGEYWIVNIARRCVEVHREPLQGRYGSLQTFTGSQEINPLKFPQVALRVDSLFPAE